MLEGLFIDPVALPQGFDGFCQIMFLFCVYGYVLAYASDMISNGSDLLLLVPEYAGVVGSIVLPVLGAVPDGMLILFSGMGDDAQNQLSVGVGALAGSTIMLLTIPWILSIYGGRVDIDHSTGRPTYSRRPKLSPGNNSLTGSGIILTSDVNKGGIIMILTSVTYLFLQGPGLYLENSGVTKSSQIASGEKPWALVGLIMCSILFVGYMRYQSLVGANEEDVVRMERQASVTNQYIGRGDISLRGALKQEILTMLHEVENVPRESSSLKGPNSKIIKKLEVVLLPFFRKYDLQKRKCLDMSELSTLFRDLGEHVPQKELEKWFSDYDKNGNGVIDFDEFTQGTLEFIQSHRDNLIKADVESPIQMMSMHDEDDDELDDDEEEMPPELANLSPEEQQHQLKLKAAWALGVGTLLVCIFSDPMVDVLDQIGSRTGLGSFCVSFLLAPIASNAAELVAAYNSSLKKTKSSISLSLATLQGAACMNNTFGLGIFMYLVYSQGLAWNYLAETLTILLVEIVMGIYSLKGHHTLLDGLVIFSLFPLSLIFVQVLESMGWN